MKDLVCYAILLLMCVAQMRADCVFEGERLPEGIHTRQCLEITCHGGGTMSLLACPLTHCHEGKQIGYRDTDFSKPYPSCCERPICEGDY